jgi:hypothetical protein
MRKAGSMRTYTKKDQTPVCVVVLQKERERERSLARREVEDELALSL